MSESYLAGEALWDLVTALVVLAVLAVPFAMLAAPAVYLLLRRRRRGPAEPTMTDDAQPL
ncbi:MAG TPA: hypothetical protein VKA37_12345 [Halobacteriales archaeon]|nr:hypothetical protein [Halobacteriales archaeon]